MHSETAVARIENAATHPDGAKALAIDVQSQLHVDVRAEANVMQRLAQAWTKAVIELQLADETEVNLPFITATKDGPLHYRRQLDMKTVKLLLARARKP